jgi:hypothetical protein
LPEPSQSALAGVSAHAPTAGPDCRALSPETSDWPPNSAHRLYAVGNFARAPRGTARSSSACAPTATRPGDRRDRETQTLSTELAQDQRADTCGLPCSSPGPLATSSASQAAQPQLDFMAMMRENRALGEARNAAERAALAAQVQEFQCRVDATPQGRQRVRDEALRPTCVQMFVCWQIG